MTDAIFARALTRLWPHGDRRVPGLVSASIAAAPAVFAKYGLSSDLVIAHAMAQFSHECGAGDEMVENLNYRAEQLLRQWPRHFTPAQAIAMQHNPRAIADQAYNGRMGNRPGTDDGWNFRGRGAAQTTGRDAYTKLGIELDLDLVNHPELVIDPARFLECGVADFIACGCLPFAQRDELFQVTQHLNGGQIGAEPRAHWLTLWKHELGVLPS
jgi:putative chitinase